MFTCGYFAREFDEMGEFMLFVEKNSADCAVVKRDHKVSHGRRYLVFLSMIKYDRWSLKDGLVNVMQAFLLANVSTSGFS